MSLVPIVNRAFPYRVRRAWRSLAGETLDLDADRASRWFAHQLTGSTLPEGFGFKVDRPGPDQPAIVARLIEYYHRLKAEFAALHLSVNHDMWAAITAQTQDVQAALERRDADTVSAALLHVCGGPLAVGFMNYKHYTDLIANPRARSYEARHFVDKLLSLSEALGCQPVQCPEQGQWGYPALDLPALLRAVRERLPMPIEPPAAGGGTFGLETEYGLLCLKDITAMYTACRALAVLGSGSRRSVAEIGGGTGTLAYYLARSGIEEISVYDLPMVSLVQGYYAMRSLGPDAVLLHGEADRPAQVRLLPYWQVEAAPDRHFSLFINQDSLPEIEAGAAARYIDLVKAKCSGHFLSLNQEGRAPNAGGVPQSVVYDLVQRSGGYERVYRFPHWMRTGYVEELYRVL